MTVQKINCHMILLTVVIINKDAITSHTMQIINITKPKEEAKSSINTSRKKPNNHTSTNTQIKYNF